MKSLCVYCASSPGTRPAYAAAAEALAGLLVERGITIVYGGSSKGIMGRLADAAIAGGGRVVGVLPKALIEKEVGHDGLHELHIVSSMHERKALMSELADAFVALPGGFGTLEEIVETVTWAQLGFHGKPCGLLNVNGYFDALSQFLTHAVDEGFIRRAHHDILQVADSPAELLEKFERYVPPDIGKWRD
ncbi:MAG: TIGR00730 family Rossman fold protein [Woeseia sp.]|nr:TIGR00730 family Rossman fold protein [Woeseia sp.]MBT8096893.1 TIGR00730 family Rossman fold protein [Woeseia sp.]NNE62204.1 TIGR00730 family Rossman fold protein [Woeseia sp.]NNL55294.1 TIGR00730 family Rossman fold protein [Woeseia sp.]